MTIPALFTPSKLGRYELKHRVVLCPMTRNRAGVVDGVPSDLQAEFYSQRATDGGFLITEATSISATSGHYPYTPGIFTKEQIAGWKKVTDAVHAKGGIIFTQIWHQGRAAKNEQIGEQVVSASAIAISGDHLMGGPHDVPRALTVPEIHAITQDFVQAALNAVEAGFDGVEIHSANGYLLDQFTNSSSNKRTDEYGGSIENRGRFTVEVIDAVSKAIGADRVGVRFSPWGEFQDMKDETPYETWGSLIEKVQEQHSDLAYVHFCEPRASMMDDSYEKQPESLDHFRKIWKGVFVSAGGYTYNTQTAFDIAENYGGLTAFGRAFLANPDLVERIRNGWPLNHYDRPTFYSTEAKGYTDYPFYKDTQ